MNVKYKTLAVFAAMMLSMTACQKENYSESNIPFVQQSTSRTVEYTIDGKMYHAVIHGDEAWQLFLEKMAALAAQGYRVTFRDESRRTEASAKDVHTFSTTDKQEAIRWCNTMYDLGYEVTMTYDAETGQYNCTAVK